MEGEKEVARFRIRRDGERGNSFESRAAVVGIHVHGRLWVAFGDGGSARDHL